MRLLSYPSWFGKLARHAPQGRVVARFRRSAYLQLGDGRAVVALVSPELGRGPLNLVAEDVPWSGLRLGDGVQVTGTQLRVGEVCLDLRGARAWDPTLPRVVPEREAVLRCLDWLVERAPSGSLAAVLPHLLHGSGPPLAPWQGRGLEGLRLLQAGEEACAARRLSGLGPGLTPSGDDALCGWILASWLLNRPAHRLLYSARATGWVSRAYLRASARGQAPEAWHRFVVSLHGTAWEPAAAEVLAVGATSGADTLTGFLLVMRSLPLLKPSEGVA